jgi:Ca-activated chloride channel homolog
MERAIMIRVAVFFFLIVSLISGATLSEYRHFNKGKSFLENEQFDAASEELKKALEDGEEIGTLYRALGDVEYKKGEYDQSLKFYEQALEISEEEEVLDLRYNIGNAYLQKQEFDKAVESYKNVLQSRPDDQNAKKNLEIALRLIQVQEQEQEQEEQQNDESDGNNDDEQENEDSQENKEDEDKNSEQDQEKPDSIEEEQAKQILKLIEESESETRQKYLQKPEVKGTIENDW